VGAAVVCAGALGVGVAVIAAPAAQPGTRLTQDRDAAPVGTGALPRAIGVLATTGASGALAGHFCSAAVVASPAGDLVITAAHCLAGHQAGQFVFVPGYDHGRAPYGVWQVSRIFIDSDWSSRSDPDDDVAFLLVARAGASVQHVAGAETMGLGLPPAQLVTVTGYPDNLDNAIICHAFTRPISGTQLEFGCGGYTQGTSGAPLLAKVNPVTGLGAVIGVIGGYQRGGSTDAVSYAARLGPEVTALYRAAVAQA
jgi:V8-like Glu-specific endopeptidase